MVIGIFSGAMDKGVRALEVNLRAKDILTKQWPLVIVGGGPAAALQIHRSRLPLSDILVITDRLGGGMGFLGEHRLQSYVSELDVGACGNSLGCYVGQVRLQPTGTEYTRYIANCIRRSDATTLTGLVTDVKSMGSSLRVEIREANLGTAHIRGHRVVMATGTIPKRPTLENLSSRSSVMYDQVFRDIKSGNLDYYRRKSILVVGSGNSALQTASLLAPIAEDITVLANQYLGMYPQETSNRFGWRAASQLACELIVKGSRQCIPGSRSVPCIRFLLYDDFQIKGSNQIMFRYRRATNHRTICRASLPPRCIHVQGATMYPNGYIEEVRDLSSTMVVWAVGMEPNYPQGETLRSLQRDSQGRVLVNKAGKTELDGLYLIGGCVGVRSVNEMTCAVVDEID